MHEHHKGSLLLVENQDKGRGMPQKSMLYILVIFRATDALAASTHPSHVQ